MTEYEVFLTSDAEEDILEIYNFVSTRNSVDKAEILFKKLKETCLSLSSHPHRGHYPPELERIEILEYREIHYKPYRIIYQVREKEVFIHCILDSRRSLQSLLQKRLYR